LNCPLLSKRWVSADTCVLKFALPTPTFTLGLPVPGHIMVVDAATNYRPYSPISLETPGSFELLVRRIPRGSFSTQLARLEPGDQATFLGPVESRYRYTRGAAPELGLIAAGTGITPMWQIIQSVLSNPEDRTKISLVYASKSEDSILLKEEIDRAASEHPDRFRACYVVGSSSGGGGGSRGRNAAQLAGNVRHGRIDEELLLAELPPPPDTTRAERMQDACQVVVCGPESMLVELCGRRARDGGTNYGPGEEAVAQARHPAIGGVLRRLGYRSNQVAWL
jgi:cytochrome-b5 reductase